MIKTWSEATGVECAQSQNGLAKMTTPGFLIVFGLGFLSAMVVAAIGVEVVFLLVTNGQSTTLLP